MPRPASAGRVTIEEAQRPRVRPTDRVTRTRRLRQRRQSPIGLSLEQVEDLELLDAAGKKADQLIEEALLDADESEPADGATADPQPLARPLRDRRRELDTYTRRKRLDGRSAPQFPPRTRVQEMAQSRRLQRPRTATLQRRPKPSATRPLSAQAKVSVGWVRPERDDEDLGIVEDDNEDGFEEAIHAWTGGFTMRASRGGVVALTQRPSRREPAVDTRVSQLVRELRARLLSKRGGRPVSQLFRLFDRRVRRKADPRDVYEGLRSLGIAATLGDAQGLVKAIARGKELRCSDLAVFLDDPDFASLEAAVCAGAASRLLPPPPVTSYAQCDPTNHAIQQLRDLFGDSFVTRSTFAEGLRRLQLDRVAPDAVRRLTTAYDLNGDGRVHARAFVKTITKSQAWKRAAKARKRVLEVAREAEEVYDQVDDEGYWPIGLDEELVEACRGLGLRCLTDTHALWVAKRALQSDLPPNWVRSHAKDGRPFFHDLVSNTSTWDRPFAPEFVSLARDAATRRRRRRLVEDDDEALVVEDDSEEEEPERISRPKSADAVRRARVVVSPEVLREAPPARVPRPASAPPRRLGPSPTPFLSPPKSASESESDEDDDAEEEASAEGAPDAEEPEPEPAPATPPRKKPSTKVAQILADLQARVRLLETTTGRRAPEPWTPDGVRGVGRLARGTPQRTPSRTGPRARKSPLPGGHTGPRPRSAGPRSRAELSRRPTSGGVVVFIK